MRPPSANRPPPPAPDRQEARGLNREPPPGFLARTVVVLPALNEALTVASTVQRWRALGVGQVRVVDNGSTDATAAVAAEAGACVVFEAQRGYGAAAWRGLQDWPETMEWVLFSAADGSDQLSLEEARMWQQALDAGADMVVGERISLLESRAALKVVQRFGNWLTCRAIRLGWGQPFRDMGSLRLVRQHRLLALQLQDRAFGWNVEMQIRAIQARWRIVEVPVRYFPRQGGDSKISGSLMGTWRAARGILGMLVLLSVLRWSNNNAQLVSTRKGAARSAP